MAIGTGAGLVTKYVLDKKFIFYYKPENFKSTQTKFLQYSLTGVFTTFLFWGIELLFDHLSQSQNAKYVGAVVGLSLGYTLKYFLDKNFVFK
jgi:putative flippase GtrA